MSKGLQEDIAKTINEVKNPSGRGTGTNWLRHRGDQNTIFDEMLLTGATMEQMAKILIDRQLEPTREKALYRVQRHFDHLKAVNKSESTIGHNLPLIEDSNGKWRFDLKKMEEMLSGSTHPLSNPTILKRHLPEKSDIEFAESQRRKTADEIIGLETVLDQVEINFKKAGKPLKENWREITKQNIKIWFSKK